MLCVCFCYASWRFYQILIHHIRADLRCVVGQMNMAHFIKLHWPDSPPSEKTILLDFHGSRIQSFQIFEKKRCKQVCLSNYSWHGHSEPSEHRVDSRGFIIDCNGEWLGFLLWPSPRHGNYCHGKPLCFTEFHPSAGKQ